MKSDWLKRDDETEIFVKSWTGEGEARAVLQISHGMAEHIGRYSDFAEFLNGNGIDVVGNDHRGHGQTGEKAGALGYFAEENGFERVMEDLRCVNEQIHLQYPGVPVILFGHSMGSFLARRYIQEYGETVDGVILSGTGGSPGIAGKLGKMIASFEKKIKGAKTPSPLLDKLSFGSFNKGIDSPKTPFDWLTRDKGEVEKYMNDPYCGFVCTSGFFYDLMTGLEDIHDDALVRKVPAKLPVLVVSGDSDPVGGYGKGVRKVIAQYEKHGLENVESRFFSGARHEILNETNRQEVYDFLLSWIEKQI